MARIAMSLALCLGALLYAEQTSFAQDRPARDANRDRLPELLWANGEAGYQTIDLSTFHADEDTLTAGIIPTVDSGPAVGVGAGVRVLILTLGGRGRVGFFHDDSSSRNVGNWQLWTLDAELGVRIPLHRLEPFVTLAGGYANLGSLDDAVAGLRDGLVSIHGANARAGAGLDYYVTPHFSIGGNLTGELLVLSRPGVPLKELAEPKRVGTLNEAKARLLEAEGSSVGSSMTVTGGAGLHF